MGKGKSPKAKFIGRNKRKAEDDDDDDDDNNNYDVDNNNNNNSDNSINNNSDNNNSINSNNDNNSSNNNNNINYDRDQTLVAINSVIIKAPMLMASVEEKTRDRCLGGVKFLILEGGQKYLKRKKSCIIS